MGEHMANSLKLTSFTHLPFETEQGCLTMSNWILQWDYTQLWVKASTSEQEGFITSEKKQALLDCLQFSSVRRIWLDPQLTETDIMLWANRSALYQKQVGLSVPTHSHLPAQSCSRSWLLKRLCDRLAAALIMISLMPFLIAIAVGMRLTSPGPLFFRQWRVGEQGRLFRVMKFRTMIPDAERYHHQVMGQQQGLHKREDDPRITAMGRWMRKWSIDELPQLINVVRGEMSLVGPRPWAIYDAIRIPEVYQHRLNALPGITGAWQVSARSNLVDLEAVTLLDLNYLADWSLGYDLKILLLTIPRVLSRSGAH